MPLTPLSYRRGDILGILAVVSSALVLMVEILR